jgi:lipoprotein-anchoring transpeptidase ErfK/SrfK
MYFYRNGQQIWSAPVGIGSPATPTPPGHFWIRERFKVTDPQSGYWPYAFGTSDYSTLTDWPGGGAVGIHGLYFAPQSIPGHVSHGCVRLQVADDDWLAAHLQVGTPLDVIWPGGRWVGLSYTSGAQQVHRIAPMPQDAQQVHRLALVNHLSPRAAG